jgi:hypothetical protein
MQGCNALAQSAECQIEQTLLSLSLLSYMLPDDSPMLVHLYLCQIFHVDAHGKGLTPKHHSTFSVPV